MHTTTDSKRRSKAKPMSTASLDALPLGPEFPPRVIKLFSRGENRTTKGVFVFDDESARSVMAAFEEHGIDLAMDFDHAALAPPTGRKRDVPGYYRPEVREDGLYALPQWTESGLAAIRPGKDDAGAPTLPEYRYTSPSFSFDPDTRRVVKLGPLALTSYPATHGAKPLTLSEGDEPSEDKPAPMDGATQPASMTQESTHMTASAILAALGAQDEAAGVAALSALNANLTSTRAELSALVSATGAKTHSEALGAIEAWKRDAAELSTLRARVQADEAARAKAARDAELDACVREGKLTPAERALDGQPTCWLTALSADALVSYRASRAPVVTTTETATKPAPDASLSVADSDLEFVQRYVPNATPAAIAAALK